MRACTPATARPESEAAGEPGQTPPGPVPVGHATSVENWRLKDGTDVLIRPICPADEPLMVKFHQTLSDTSVYFRYLGPLKLGQRIAHHRLTRVCLNYPGHELALVAATRPAQGTEAEILGVGRLIKFPETDEAEFALLVSDPHQSSGLGKHLLRLLIKLARKEGYARLIGYILPYNRAMLHICGKLGFRCIHPPGDPVVKVELTLTSGRRVKGSPD